MTELRQNLASSEWVIIAPERGQRPFDMETQVFTTPVSKVEYSPNCPFCPNNEDKFPLIEQDRIVDEQGNWVAKVIDNKYKLFSDFDSCPPVPGEFEKEGIYQKLHGCGEHEVVIESNKHNKVISDFSKKEIGSILSLYLKRFNVHRENESNLITAIFKNYGIMAGQTQPHSHSQIVSSRVVFGYIRSLLHEAERHFDTYGNCLYCCMLKYELEQKVRIVYKNEDYVAFVPFAAGAEHEVWVLPKIHSGGLHHLDEGQVESLADVFFVILRKYYTIVGNPDFNYVFRVAPHPFSDVPFFHWHIQFQSRTRVEGGFTRGTKIMYNTITPEESAKKLRECEGC